MLSAPTANSLVTPRTLRGYLARTASRQPAPAVAEPEGVELAYETVEWTPPEGVPPDRCAL